MDCAFSSKDMWLAVETLYKITGFSQVKLPHPFAWPCLV